MTHGYFYRVPPSPTTITSSTIEFLDTYPIDLILTIICHVSLSIRIDNWWREREQDRQNSGGRVARITTRSDSQSGGSSTAVCKERARQILRGVSRRDEYGEEARGNKSQRLYLSFRK
jgi:hypothetical protein